MKTDIRHPQELFIQPIRYRIPRFQRRYVWTQEKQWEPLWEDVEKLAQSILEGDRNEAHFMGAIVLQQQRVPSGTMQGRIVVDGQQRLTTLQLLVGAIKEVLEGRGHVDPASSLESLVVNQKHYSPTRNPDHRYKVWPTIRDRDAFKHAMCNKRSPARDTTSRIVQAYDYFKNRADLWLDRLSAEPGEHKAAAALAEAVEVGLDIVVIDLDHSDNPNAIFETLNARGTPLRQSDMVKNKILYEAEFGLADDDSKVDEEELKHLWPFDQDDWWDVKVGRGFQRRARIDLYLNHWLTLRNKAATRAYNEFRVFDRYARDEVNEGRGIQDVARDLGKIGRVYRELEEIQRNDIRRFLERRKVMNVGAITPLLLWLLSNGLSDTIKTCLRVLESFLVRRVVCGYSARGYGKLFVELIKMMDKEEEPDSILVSYLCDQTGGGRLWPNDAELLTCFETAPLYRWLTRGRLGMVLEGIEEERRTDKAEFQDVRGSWEIEHIMPQAWRDHYPLSGDPAGREEAAEKRDRTVHTIGNLTLVSKNLNLGMSNAPWEKKKEDLARHAVLYLNKDIVTMPGPDVWDENKIASRAKQLHEAAVRVWPYGVACL